MTHPVHVPGELPITEHSAVSGVSPLALAAGAKLSSGDSDAAGYFDAYAALTRTLRGWLVAFGVGTPVVIASQANLSERLAASGSASIVATLFLAGVSLQIAATLLYKSCMWYSYRKADEPEKYQHTKRFRVSRWISEQFWLELLFDASTIACFVAALFRLLRAVL